jgi:hypothetical protein
MTWVRTHGKAKQEGNGNPYEFGMEVEFEIADNYTAPPARTRLSGLHTFWHFKSSRLGIGGVPGGGCGCG